MILNDSKILWTNPSSPYFPCKALNTQWGFSFFSSSAKYPLASRDLEKGTIINEKDINFKRIDANKKNFLIDNYYELLGKKLLEKKKFDTPFFKKNFKWRIPFYP